MTCYAQPKSDGSGIVILSPFIRVRAEARIRGFWRLPVDMRPKSLIALNSSYVRDQLRIQGIRQWWLAERLGVTPRTVCRWVNGVKIFIPAQTFYRLAAELSSQPHDLEDAETRE